MRTVDCPSCGAHFALPEDLYERKVVGRKAKLRCKICGERVEIDGTNVQDLWLVSDPTPRNPSNTQRRASDREMSTTEVCEAIASRGLTRDSLVWKEGLEEWTPLNRVERFVPALTKQLISAPAEPRLPPQKKPHPPAKPPPKPPRPPKPSDDADPKPPKRPVEPLFECTPLEPRRKTAPEPRPTVSDDETRPSEELHALFDVASEPPPPVSLADSDLKSLPPSDGPLGWRSPLAIPRAPRAFDPFVSNEPSDVLLAPPSAGSLARAFPDPPVELDSEELDSEELDIPIDDDLAVPEPIVARPSSDAASPPHPAPHRKGVVVPFLIGGFAVAAVVAVVFTSRTGEGPPSPPHDPPIAQSASSDREPTPTPSAAPAPSQSQKSVTQIAKASPKERATARAPSGVSRAPDNPVGARATTTSEQKPTTTPVKKPQKKLALATFDKNAARSALAAAAASASSCRSGNDPTGRATVLVTFAPSGRATNANLTGPPFAGTATGGCIAARMRSARVPPFSGSHVTVSKTIIIH